MCAALQMMARTAEAGGPSPLLAIEQPQAVAFIFVASVKTARFTKLNDYLCGSETLVSPVEPLLPRGCPAVSSRRRWLTGFRPIPDEVSCRALCLVVFLEIPPSHHSCSQKFCRVIAPYVGDRTSGFKAPLSPQVVPVV